MTKSSANPAHTPTDRHCGRDVPHQLAYSTASIVAAPIASPSGYIYRVSPFYSASEVSVQLIIVVFVTPARE